jgi:hypothetical protein
MAVVVVGLRCRTLSTSSVSPGSCFILCDAYHIATLHSVLDVQRNIEHVKGHNPMGARILASLILLVCISASANAVVGERIPFPPQQQNYEDSQQRALEQARRKVQQKQEGSKCPPVSIGRCVKSLKRNKSLNDRLKSL